MTEENRSRRLSFDGKYIQASLVETVRDYDANGVVTNLSNEAMIVDGGVSGVVPPWKSTILRGGTIARAERVSIVDVPDATNLGGIMFDGWDWFGNRLTEFPRTTPLFISKHDVVGQVALNPWRFSNHPEPRDETVHYDIQLNLWWAPAKTDAVIHNTHSFLEIHTQIFGLGRIQIFHDQAGENLYREISTAPGDTHDPIVRVADTRHYTYPWHRGWTDEDCVWMAIELHPKTA
ncbi:MULTISPECIES: hypothetical protein [unclassified Mesorhizobium]|uniref:hypothetical protein n=1 Tax=unclassified Mesorhizobium TaxID=325217 RepID=UPI000FDA104F|nr:MULTISPECIES: hypothetical protein [unclassified Mesorhizobium]TGQ04773.1 hypothetical protein EN862_031240 [Mesorhizobium sp. M2E.F.Ca.ET.219.01.1.1]TGT65517.1 hypothetical protein EN809_032260 [Mesorhizobium sp. M2E.F.Ca.ET.166.01.1.1]TGV97564.1 hypothetical protein EN797_032270 [Mesorhizobium sp. M2E.F.Ca.ET.154.01.1.1]